jgi:hypothetical protein
MAKIRGKIIRILNPETFIINLGSSNRIEEDSIFSILGSPENVVDPNTDEDLGAIQIVKGRLKADKVYDKFTIAVSRWIEATYLDFIINPLKTKDSVHEEKLFVNEKDIQPWKSLKGNPVSVGDDVETEISVPRPPAPPNSGIE